MYVYVFFSHVFAYLHLRLFLSALDHFKLRAVRAMLALSGEEAGVPTLGPLGPWQRGADGGS